MSHHFIVPANENGISLDPDIGTDLGIALADQFGFNHVFLYSHGWWTNAILAMRGYNRFTIEFSAQFRLRNTLSALPTLSIGIHWPSTLTEDQLSILNYAEALSFFTMEKRADAVGENCGETLLKFVLAARQSGPLAIHLVGHSFGCKVICKALEKIAEEAAANPLRDGVRFDAVLLQAAFDNDELAAGKDYEAVAALPGMRVLITRSDGDKALGSLYPKAHRLAHPFRSSTPALGNSGPAQGVIDRFGGLRAFDVGPDFDATAVSPLNDRLSLANLTPLHDAHPEASDPNSGHHSDVFRSEIYKLMAAFFFGV
jgi:hypothetical protein